MFVLQFSLKTACLSRHRIEKVRRAGLRQIRRKTAFLIFALYISPARFTIWGMNHLHPYWRMAYIETPKSEKKWENPFVEIPKQQDEKSVHLIYRGKTGYIVMNSFPYNAGHLLVIPYRAVPMLADLTVPERAEMMELIVLAQKILTDALRPDGFNVGFNFGEAAGAGIPQHLHCHIVPRWAGDSNFMPVLADTRTLVESMDSMWERLKKFTPT